MILKDILNQVIVSQQKDLISLPLGIPREMLKQIDLTVPQAIILTGIRRCGKSTLLRQLMETQKNHYYFNFEDQKIASFEIDDFEKLEELFPVIYGNSIYHFFDEIQNVPKWELFIRKLLNSGKRCILTGSNASLLSKELGTRLTGRHLNYELFPLSYLEYLKYCQQKPEAGSSEEYFQKGGFPEYLQNAREQFLQELLRDILTRDIIIRHKIRESKKIQELAIYLLTNVGKELSYNNLAKLFAFGSTNTVINFISYLEESYLLFTVPKFFYSYKRQLVNPKKIYGIDNGLITANSVTFSPDQGRMLENAVFLQLRRYNSEIFYFKENKECDFLIKEKNQIKEAIQVCWEVNSDNKEREVAGLKEAMDKFNLSKGKIITFNQEDRLWEISLIPFWKWAGR